jgi:hypothetical protein
VEIETLELMDNHFQIIQSHTSEHFSPQVVFLFGDTDAFKHPQYYSEIQQRFPCADILGCSSSGNIMGPEISQSSIVATAVQFNTGRVKLASLDFTPGYQAEAFELELAKVVSDLQQDDIKHLFVLSDGLSMNGSDLVNGINKVASVPVTGGMAGDGRRFQETWVVANDIPKQNRVAILAFYGDALSTSCASYAGWSEFGAERLITKSIGNVVYEIDGQPALDLYKHYLGTYAVDLPSSGLRFPLNIKADDSAPEVIRTLQSIDEDAKSLTFSGNVPEGYRARLMQPDMDALIDGAGLAAQEIEQANEHTALGLVVSCVGRKVVMGQMVEEELDALEDVLGPNVQLSGFYSYGEISPFNKDSITCILHNQTMTLTTIYEEL